MDKIMNLLENSKNQLELKMDLFDVVDRDLPALMILSKMIDLSENLENQDWFYKPIEKSKAECNQNISWLDELPLSHYKFTKAVELLIKLKLIEKKNIKNKTFWKLNYEVLNNTIKKSMMK